MGYLIEADKLLKCWNDLSARGRTEFDQVIMCMPAAYNVDEVIRQISEMANVDGNAYLDCADVIEIIKEGGIREK